MHHPLTSRVGYDTVSFVKCSDGTQYPSVMLQRSPGWCKGSAVQAAEYSPEQQAKRESQ